MDRQTTFLLALGLLAAAAFTVGLSGWVLLVRDRTLARSGLARPSLSSGDGDANHHEGLGES